MNRITRFLLSNAHLAGCAGAAVVLVFYLLGVLHARWFTLAVLAYGLGYVSMAKPKAKAAPLLAGASTTETLAWLRHKVMPALPSDCQAILGKILDVSDGLMPRLKEMEVAGSIQTENRTLLKQTITRYLPAAVENYLKLPPVYAATARVANGKTANQLLHEQLALLLTHVTAIQEGMLSSNVDALLANGQFLQQKFTKSIEQL